MVPLEIFGRWQKEGKFLAHDGVVDFPWMLLKAKQSEDRAGFLIDSIQSVKSKLQTLIRVWELGFKEFVTDRSSIESIKHYGAVQRHLVELTQEILGRRRVRQGSLSELLREVEKIKS